MLNYDMIFISTFLNTTNFKQHHLGTYIQNPYICRMRFHRVVHHVSHAHPQWCIARPCGLMYYLCYVYKSWCICIHALWQAGRHLWIVPLLSSIMVTWIGNNLLRIPGIEYSMKSSWFSVVEDTGCRLVCLDTL